MIAPSPRARLAILAACLGSGALALTAGPPAPRPVDAPAGEFSALRAREHLVALLGDERPHPVGSAEDHAVRGRLVERLRAMGLAPEELRAFACSPHGTCAPVVDVLVTIPGAQDLPAVAIASHYDSVPAGPGAADDGHGVALDLEVLRILAAEAPHPRPLVAIFTDGEEVGLLGAEALAADPRIKSIDVVVNAEARGTGGASRMFETSTGNGPLVAAFAGAAPSPSATSLSVEVYRRLPNDTDLSVLMRAGVAGLNFAFIGGVRRYHTPRDDLAHLDLASLQHQGEGVLASARALLAEEGPIRGESDAIYADLYGRVVLRWPAPLSLPFFAAGLLTVLLAAAQARRAGALRLRAVALALAGLVVAPAIASVAALGLLAAIDRLSTPLGPWPAGGASAFAATAAFAAAAALLVLRGAAARAGFAASAIAFGLLGSLAGLALAAAIPGASILFAPALLVGPALLLGARRPTLAVAGLALAGALAFALWAPLVPALAEGPRPRRALVGAPSASSSAPSRRRSPPVPRDRTQGPCPSGHGSWYRWRSPSRSSPPPPPASRPTRRPASISSTSTTAPGPAGWSRPATAGSPNSTPARTPTPTPTTMPPAGSRPAPPSRGAAGPSAAPPRPASATVRARSSSSAPRTAPTAATARSRAASAPAPAPWR
ncbi:MAG: M20/M25/M40 family metallo-hydrolase [Nannocystaceae bacterium]